MHGTFEDGFPFIEIGVTGSGGNVTTFKVIVDTGFNGYLSLPYAVAFPIGLTLVGTGSGRVADGNFSPYLKCIGTVAYGDKKVPTVIDVQQNSRPLLGTALLKELGCILTVDAMSGKTFLEQVR